MVSSLRTTTLDAALRFIPTHSFTRQAIKEGYLLARPSSLSTTHAQEHPQVRINGTQDAEVDAVLDSIFGPGESAGKALVEVWEKRGLEYMIEGEGSSSTSTSTSTSASNSTSTRIPRTEGYETGLEGLEQRLRRRLEYSEKTAGEGLIQAHALLQASTGGTSVPLPRTLGYMIGRMKEGWEGWEVYTPPGSVGGSSSSSGGVASEVAGSTESILTAGAKAHHIPLPIPPNPLRSLGYAWRIIDQAMYLDHLAQVNRNREGGGGEGFKRSTEERMMGEREGEGLGWYKKRMGLSLIYLRAESVLMLPRNQRFFSPNESPLDRATTTLDALLQAHHAGSNSTPEIEVTAQGAGGMEGRRLKEAVEFGRFIFHSWGGLFRSRGWIL